MLEGTWHLTGWEIEEAGRITRPFGAAPTGLLLYTADGTMSACIARDGRRPFTAASPRAAPEAERAAAHDSYFHYAGTYEVIPGPAVIHRVTHALNPGLIGTEQVRAIALDGARLVLSAEEPLPGGIRRHRLSWRR